MRNCNKFILKPFFFIKEKLIAIGFNGCMSEHIVNDVEIDGDSKTCLLDKRLDEIDDLFVQQIA